MSGSTRAHNPHDSLVRYTFSRPEAVAIIVRRVANPELLPLIDFDSLRPLPTVSSDALLRTRAADLRFAVDLVDEGVRMPLQLALEHQSSLETLMPCRIHVYVGDMWSEFIREHPQARTVPAILPILLLQHPARNTPYQLSRVFALTPRLRRLLGPTVEIRMRIDDLSGSVLDDQAALPAIRALVELTRALLHAYRNPDTLTPERMTVLAPQFDILLAQDEPLGTSDVGALWRYVIDVFEPDSPLRSLIVESVGKRAREMYTTIADQLRAEGKAEGKAEALLGVLRHRALTIPEGIRKRVLSTVDEQQLQQWFDRAFTVASADELFEARDG